MVLIYWRPLSRRSYGSSTCTLPWWRSFHSPPLAPQSGQAWKFKSIFTRGKRDTLGSYLGWAVLRKMNIYIQRELIYDFLGISLSRALDPDSLNPDTDPAFKVNPDTDPDPVVWWPKTEKKNTAEIFLKSFLNKKLQFSYVQASFMCGSFLPSWIRILSGYGSGSSSLPLSFVNNLSIIYGVKLQNTGGKEVWKAARWEFFLYCSSTRL